MLFTESFHEVDAK